MKITLELGGYLLVIHESQHYPSLAWPLRPFRPFLAESDRPADIRVDVSLASCLPDLSHGGLRYDAVRGLWKLYEGDAGFAFESLDPHTLRPRLRALVSADYRTIQAWILPEQQTDPMSWCPMHLINPMVEVCFLSRLALDRGMLLHGAGVRNGHTASVFTGPSGAGKSTIANFFAERGAEVFSDERVILRRHTNGWSVYGTPWVGSGAYAANASASLSKVFCIRHGTGAHRQDPLLPRRAIPLLLQQAFLPFWDREAMETSLDTLLSLTQELDCRHLAFLKQTDVVEFLGGLSPMLTRTLP